MPQAMHARTRRMTIVAQDPAVLDDQGRIVTAEVEIPAERLAPGPCGYRVHIIDYDTSSRTLYKPADLEPAPGARPLFENPGDDVILGDPRFHAQNVYAIVMRILGRFELALGRRVSWGFPSHQLKVAPHAFVDANAFYSERDEALVFGYFPGRDGKPVFSCLSHDVVAHEATHALIDGLRGRFTDPSSPDQAAFHEGFADVVALLSVFALRDVVKATLDRSLEKGPERPPAGLVHEDFLKPDSLRDSVLLGLAQQMGEEMSLVRGRVLRRSIKLTPEEIRRDPIGFREEHRRGEILVAAMLNAFLSVWTGRLESLGRIDGKYFDRERIAEEAADAADYLLTMSIRALDYTPPVHLHFADFLSALLTADYVIRPDDSKYRYREKLRESFARYGIKPASQEGMEEGIWRRTEGELDHDCIHFESMTRDRDEVFRFVWENRKCLGLYEGAYTRVETLRPCLRTAPDGFILRETVVECTQQLEIPARKLHELDIEKPRAMPADTLVKLQGGLTLIFDERGYLSFSISNQLAGDRVTGERQSRRLQDLWDYGQFKPGASLHRRFSVQHRRRALDSLRFLAEVW